MNKDFLFTLLDSTAVSGYEIPLQKQLIQEMMPHCDRILTDYTGNVIAVLNPQASFRVLLTGHIDEIGLVITHILPDGFLRVAKVGGIYPSLYPGHQVSIQGYAGQICGSVVHCKATEKADLAYSDLIIDIGAKDEADARRYVREGDPLCPNVQHQEMCNGFLCARAVDDRSGVFIIMEALKRAREKGCRIGVYAAATVGEETTMRGARWAGSSVKPHVGIAVDVTFAQDYPGADPGRTGNIRLGKGPVLCNSSLAGWRINALLQDCANDHNIPYQLETYAGPTGTDADKLHNIGGMVTALISLPLRYMHSPSEVCHLDDIENTIELLSEFLCSIDEHTSLDPFREN